MVHALKINQEYFNPVCTGAKPFEVRRNDRPFKVGDYLALNELDKKGENYTGRFVLAKITYILEDDTFCKEGYVTLGIQRVYVTER